MQKSNLKKKLELNKVTIAGLNAANQDGVRGGNNGDTDPSDKSCKPCAPIFRTPQYTCGNTCRATCAGDTACYFTTAPEPTDPTYN
ncbi:MAG: hypothetical protein GY765_34450 [bacterium]|nr:hypothetical protein [bacterium]